MTDDGVRIVPIAPNQLGDLDRLFSRGDPRTCQCTYVRLTNADWNRSSPEANRDLHHQAIRDAAAGGRAAGLLAYDGDNPVGWVSFGPRQEFDRLTSPLLRPVDDRPVWSVVCFVIAPGFRRRGLATRLLAAAEDYAREHGVITLEGYPVVVEGKRPSADLWRGTLSMFERRGFRTVEVRRHNASAPPRPIVRKDL
jgi:GNAT superfamily N-acetyltransferase